MSRGFPAPHQIPIIGQFFAEVWYRWFGKLDSELTAAQADIATINDTLENGVTGADGVTATNAFTTDTAILVVDGLGRKAKQSTATVDANGNLTIASTSTLTTLQYRAKSNLQSRFAVDTYGASQSLLNGRRARGTEASPTAVLANDALFNIGGRGNDGTAGFEDGFTTTYALLSFRASENWGASNHGTQFSFFTTLNGGPGQVERLQIQNSGHTRPGADNSYTCGTSSFRWSDIYAVSGSVNTSDEREKTIVGDLSFAGRMVDIVEPILFTWNSAETTMVADPNGEMEPNPAGDVDRDGNIAMQPKMVPQYRAGSRPHAGWSAQRVRAAMEELGAEFGAWCLLDKNDPNSRQMLRPDQLGAIAWEALRQTRAELRALQARVEQLEAR